MSGLGEHFGWVEILFSATIAFTFGFYQLWSVNREIRRDRESARRPRDQDAPSPPQD